MASTYPSVVATLTDPLASQFLNSPSHSSIHSSENAEIKQIQTFVGTLPASAVGTLMYDVRSPASGGGGHVQTAVLGGTGQTTYLVGDTLVATSSSSLSRLAVGSDNQVLTANSSVQGGITWGGLNRVAVNTSSVILTGGAASVATVLYSASISGGILGTSGAIRFTGTVLDMLMTNSFTVNVQYGGNNVCSVVSSLITAGGPTGRPKGTIEGYLVSNGFPSSQMGFVKLNLNESKAGNNTLATDAAYGSDQGTVGTDSTNMQSLVVTGKFNAVTGSITGGMFVVEKIV